MLNIAITHKDRNNYLRLTLASLREACRGHDDVKIYLYDDGSTNLFPEIMYEMGNLEVIQMYGSYQIIEGESAPRYKHVLGDMFERTGADHIFIADSDAAFHPQAIRVIKEMIADLPQLGMGSIFNTVNFGDGPSFVDGKYVHKMTVGMFCTVVSRTAWERYGINIPKSFDMALTGGIESDPELEVRVTFQSYVEHMGHEGVHNRGNVNAMDYVDRSKRFFND